MKKQNNIKTLEFIYQEMGVQFLVNPNDKNVMINATEMAKMFDKRTGHYLNNESTKLLIDELERTEMSARSDFKILDNRGHMGIYFCELLALDFAAWLDVKFKIWIYSTIRDLLTKETKIVKNTISEIKTAEQNLEETIAKAKLEGNKEALEIIEAFEKRDLAKKNKDKAMRIFTNQMKMNL